MELEISTGEQYALIGAAILLVGTFMPWIRSIVVYSGVDTRIGTAIVFGALVVGGIALFRDWSRTDQAVVGAVGVGSVIGAGWKYLDIRAASQALDLGQEVSFSLVNPGTGLFVTMGGGLVTIAAAVVGYRRGESTAGAFR